jgi:hypothetical protein
LIAPQPSGGVQAILKGEAIQASLIKAESKACGRPRYKHAPYVYVYDASSAATLYRTYVGIERYRCHIDQSAEERSKDAAGSLSALDTFVQ